MCAVAKAATLPKPAELRILDPKLLTPGRNPRKTFDPSQLEELAESIRRVGVLEPVLVRESEDYYEIVCGERRVRAAVLADLETIPALVRQMDDAEALEAAIVENLQRVDVDPLEEADGFRALIAAGQYDEAGLAERLGRTLAYVVGRLRLAGLSDEVRSAISARSLPIGLAQLLAPFDPKTQNEYLDRLAAGYQGGWLPIAEARKLLKEQATIPISRASWPLDSDGYGRACDGCPKRTGGQPTLMPELAGEDLCTDRTCWGDKLRLAAQERLDADPGLMVPEYAEGRIPKMPRARQVWIHQVADKPHGKTDVEVRALTIERDQLVVKKGWLPKARTGGSDAAKHEADRLASKRKVKVERVARRLMSDALRAASDISGWLDIAAKAIWDGAVLSGDRDRRWIAKQMGWEIDKEQRDSVRRAIASYSGKNPVETLRLMACLAVARVLAAEQEYDLVAKDYQGNDPCAVVAALGVDVEACRKAAEEEVAAEESAKAGRAAKAAAKGTKR